MAGHDAIRAGITWGLGIIEQPHFVVRHELTDDDLGRVAAVEVDTNHKLNGGGVMTFTQMFVGEVNDDGLLGRMESFTSYPPPATG
jgi:hypothetical protein